MMVTTTVASPTLPPAIHYAPSFPPPLLRLSLSRIPGLSPSVAGRPSASSSGRGGGDFSNELTS